MSHSLRRARDELLALRCQLGEPEAFADLVSEMERPLLFFARQFVSDDQRARDIVQEVWMRTLRSIRKLRDLSQLRAWLYQQTRSLAWDSVRQHVARQQREEHYAAQRPLMQECADPDFTHEDIAALQRGLGLLPLLQREVLVLHFLDELGIAEMAAVTGCPEGTVKSRLYHAKRALKALLNESHDE